MSTPSSQPALTQITISTDTLQALREMAQRQNITLSDALRQAINVGKLLVHETNDKDTRILLKNGNQVRELKLLPKS